MRTALVLYPSSATACGIGTWVESLAASLPQHGWQVRVGLAWGRRFHDPARVEAFRPSLRTLRMDARSGTEEARIQAIAGTVMQARPDVVLLTVLDSGFEALRRCRHAGSPARLVAVNHGNLPEQAACLQQHQDVVDMAVCVSRLSHGAMAAAPGGFAPHRLRHVPNAVQVPASHGTRRTGGPLVVGYVGRLAAEKRATDIVPFFRALHARLPQAQLWVAGAGEVLPAVQSLAAQHPAQVRCFGECPAARLQAEFYPHVDVLVHFSEAEAWGYSIAEAMAHGVVPVCSDFAGRAQDGLVQHGVTGLVFPVGDVQRAAQHVAMLEGDPSLRVRLGHAAARLIGEQFTMDLFGRRWAGVLDEGMQLPPLPMPAPPASLGVRGPLGIPRHRWEPLRRRLGRQVPHASPGEEWPHFRSTDPALVARYAAALRPDHA